MVSIWLNSYHQPDDNCNDAANDDDDDEREVPSFIQ